MRGIQPGNVEAPLPAVVNEEFLELADASLGDDVILGVSTYSVLANIVAVASYFPIRLGLSQYAAHQAYVDSTVYSH